MKPIINRVMFPFVSVGLSLFISSAGAKTITIPQSGASYRIVSGVSLGVQPGDVIEVEAGAYETLSFRDIVGAPGNPVRIINKGGQVVCGGNGSTAIVIQGCRYLHLTGTGAASSSYGFLAATPYENNGSHAVNVVNGSSDIEIDHVEVSSAGFAGFNVKDEIRADGLYNRGNFLMCNIRLHHNYVHGTRAEGFYIGHTFYNGQDIGGTLYYPHLISGLKVYNNRTYRTGAEGIQIGSTIRGMEVYDNLVEEPGIDPFAEFQDNGIQIGYSSGVVIGNTVRDSASAGIILLTQGNVVVASNVIERAGTNAVYASARIVSVGSLATGGGSMGKGFVIVNNTIIDPSRKTSADNTPRSAINIAAAAVTDTNVVYNNLIVGGAGPAHVVGVSQAGTLLDEQRTRYAATASTLAFANPNAGDYSLLAGSPLIDAGVGVQRFGVHRDRAGNGRTAGVAVDIGAFEKTQSFTTDPIADSITGNFAYPYRLFIPNSAAEDNPLPLIVFLHGFGERGAANSYDNQRQVKAHIQPLINTARGPRYAAYLLAPQAPNSWSGGGANVVKLVNQIAATYSVDTSRIYVTGLSDGGRGTWETLAAGGKLFAAGIPLSAVISTDSVAAIAAADIPVWAFHGASDTVVGVSSTRTMITQLLAAGALPRYTERAGWGHSSWSSVYGETSGWTNYYANGDPDDKTLELYAWMFSQQTSVAKEPVAFNSGKVFLFDFGGAVETLSPDASGRHWNNIGNSAATVGAEVSGLITSTGLSTAAILRTVDGFIDGNSLGVQTDTFYPNSAQRDNLYAGSFTDRADGLTNPGAVRLQGLPPETRCRVTAFNSRTTTDGGKDRLTRFTIGNQWRDLDAVDNSNRIAVFDNVLTDTSGRLEIEVALSPVGNGKFCYISALEVEIEPKIATSALTSNASSFSLEFPTRKAWIYKLQESDELDEWITLESTAIIGDGTPKTMVWQRPAATHRFYRLIDEKP